MHSLRNISIRKLLSGGRQASSLTASDFKQLRITGTIEYVAGAVTLATIVTLPDSDRADNSAFLVLAGVGVLLAALRFTVPQRIETIRASMLIGFLYIATIIAVARPVGATPFFFLWPMITTGYYLGRKDLTMMAGAFSLALIAGLAANPSSLGFDVQMFVPVQWMILIASGLALALREHADGLMSELKYTASTDVLTGIANRRTFIEAFDRELERARRTKTPLSIALFDLDHFKTINDRLGHAEGDKALQRFATLLATQCRVVDFPARIGGEEFALILSNADAEGARVFSQRLIEQLQAVTANDLAPLAVSVGVAEVGDPTDTQDLLLLAADRALYEAKNTGRGKVVVARSSSPSRAEHTGELLEFTHQGPAPVDAAA